MRVYLPGPAPPPIRVEVPTPMSWQTVNAFLAENGYCAQELGKARRELLHEIREQVESRYVRLCGLGAPALSPHVLPRWWGEHQGAHPITNLLLPPPCFPLPLPAAACRPIQLHHAAPSHPVPPCLPSPATLCCPLSSSTPCSPLLSPPATTCRHPALTCLHLPPTRHPPPPAITCRHLPPLATSCESCRPDCRPIPSSHVAPPTVPAALYCSLSPLA